MTKKTVSEIKSFEAKSGHTYFRNEKKLDYEERKAKLSQPGFEVKVYSDGLCDDQKIEKKPVQKRSWRRWTKESRLLDNIGDYVPMSSVIRSNSPLYGAYNLYLSKENEEKIRRQEERLRLIECQRTFHHSKSCRNCNQVPILKARNEIELESDIVTTIKVSKEGYGFAGLTTCDNGFCVHCSSKKRKERVERITHGCNVLEADGFLGGFATLTQARHDYLLFQLECQRRGYRNIQRRLARTGWEYEIVRGFDSTFSDDEALGTNHLHIHALIYVKGEGATQEALNQLVKEAWLGSIPEAEPQCQDIQPIESKEKLAGYIAKTAGLSLELSSGQTKEAKSWKSKTLPQLMKEATDGSKWAQKTYTEFTRDSAGLQMLTFSNGWPKPPEEEEEEEEFIGWELDVPYLWYSVCWPVLQNIGLLLWLGLLQGGKIGMQGFHDLEFLFELRTYTEVWEELGCDPELVREAMLDEIWDWLDENTERMREALSRPPPKPPDLLKMHKHTEDTPYFGGIKNEFDP